jgi:alginate O-acetyltransferase complex protein AlgI
MAIGLGKFFGFRFLENFNYPYISRSIREFWRRWHISLSNWFRDYLYIPLGGNQAGICRLYINLVIVFLLCGLWHGANWTFVFWGLYHGLFLVLERIGFDRIINRLWQPFQHIYTLLVVIIGWVFFRSDDLVYSLAFLKAMFGMGESSDAIHPIGEYMTNELIVTLIVGAVASTGAYNWIIRNGRDLVANETKLVPNNSLGSAILAASEPIYLTLVFVIVLTYLAAGTYNPFIYFRF